MSGNASIVVIGAKSGAFDDTDLAMSGFARFAVSATCWSPTGNRHRCSASVRKSSALVIGSATAPRRLCQKIQHTFRLLGVI
jgi:hypothetical protein